MSCSNFINDYCRSGLHNTRSSSSGWQLLVRGSCWSGL